MTSMEILTEMTRKIVDDQMARDGVEHVANLLGEQLKRDLANLRNEVSSQLEQGIPTTPMSLYAQAVVVTHMAVQHVNQRRIEQREEPRPGWLN